MALTSAQKAKATKSYQRHDKDTGSPEYQVALLTEEINRLTQHFKVNKHDNHGKRGLVRKVNSRRRLLDYLKEKDEKAYNRVVKKLGLKR